MFTSLLLLFFSISLQALLLIGSCYAQLCVFPLLLFINMNPWVIDFFTSTIPPQELAELEPVISAFYRCFDVLLAYLLAAHLRRTDTTPSLTLFSWNTSCALYNDITLFLIHLIILWGLEFAYLTSPEFGSLMYSTFIDPSALLTLVYEIFTNTYNMEYSQSSFSRLLPGLSFYENSPTLGPAWMYWLAIGFWANFAWHSVNLLDRSVFTYRILNFLGQVFLAYYMVFMMHLIPLEQYTVGFWLVDYYAILVNVFADVSYPSLGTVVMRVFLSGCATKIVNNSWEASRRVRYSDLIIFCIYLTCSFTFPSFHLDGDYVPSSADLTLLTSLNNNV